MNVIEIDYICNKLTSSIKDQHIKHNETALKMQNIILRNISGDLQRVDELLQDQNNELKRVDELLQDQNNELKNFVNDLKEVLSSWPDSTSFSSQYLMLKKKQCQELAQKYDIQPPTNMHTPSSGLPTVEEHSTHTTHMFQSRLFL